MQGASASLVQRYQTVALRGAREKLEGVGRLGERGVSSSQSQRASEKEADARRARGHSENKESFCSRL